MPSDDEMLALNELTGLVHEYRGTGPDGITSEEHELPVGILPCGCEGFEEAVESNSVVMIRGRHLERGIWEPADCLKEEHDAN